jgi:hypothetical protein
MKKYLILLLVAATLVSISACEKDDDSDDNPPEVTTYNVEYTFEVNENHGDVKLVYYGPSLDKKEVENPDSPWQMSFDDFKPGDSVFFHLNILPLANTQLIYSYKVNITNGSDFVGGEEGSGNTQYLDTVPPVNRSWAYKISE